MEKLQEIITSDILNTINVDKVVLDGPKVSYGGVPCGNVSVGTNTCSSNRTVTFWYEESACGNLPSINVSGTLAYNFTLLTWLTSSYVVVCLP